MPLVETERAFYDIHFVAEKYSVRPSQPKVFSKVLIAELSFITTPRFFFFFWFFLVFFCASCLADCSAQFERGLARKHPYR